MARIFRANDRVSGAPIALKVLQESSAHLADRFQREADVLATLVHPAIVRHVAHGKTATGELYLAMEWLEGTTLSERLKAGGLTANESVELSRRIADGLGAA